MEVGLSSKEMTQWDYIELCRYYKGEAKNPYEGKEQNKAMLWDLEKKWVDIELDPKANLVYVFEEYKNKGMLYFAKDGVSEHLKAVIFNSYMKTSYDGDVRPFKEFYSKYYK